MYGSVVVVMNIGKTQDASHEDHFPGRNIFFFSIYMKTFITLFTSLYYICFSVCSLTKYEDYKTYVTQVFFQRFLSPLRGYASLKDFNKYVIFESGSSF